MQYCLALNQLKDILWVDFIYFKISYLNSIDKQQLGPRLLIKFLQDAAGKGELDPWDIDVISVIDSFLEQYSQTVESKSNGQSSYHKNLSETSEAFFAASVLVNLKAQVLESDVFNENSSDFEDDFDVDDQDWIDQEFDIPKYPEKYLTIRYLLN